MRGRRWLPLAGLVALVWALSHLWAALAVRSRALAAPRLPPAPLAAPRRPPLPNPRGFAFLSRPRRGEARSWALIKSAACHFESRAKVRADWAHWKTRRLWPKSLRMVFLLSYTPSCQRGVVKESAQFGDLIVGALPESYKGQPLKMLQGFYWLLTEGGPFAYAFFVDEDVFFSPAYAVETLEGHVATFDSFFFGRRTEDTIPERNPASKYFVPEDQFPGDIYPPFLYGWCYAGTPDAIAAVYNVSQYFHLFPMQDVYLGMLAAAAGVSLIGTRRLIFHHEMREPRLIAAHLDKEQGAEYLYPELLHSEEVERGLSLMTLQSDPPLLHLHESWPRRPPKWRPPVHFRLPDEMNRDANDIESPEDWGAMMDRLHGNGNI